MLLRRLLHLEYCPSSILEIMRYRVCVQGEVTSVPGLIFFTKSAAVTEAKVPEHCTFAAETRSCGNDSANIVEKSVVDFILTCRPSRYKN